MDKNNDVCEDVGEDRYGKTYVRTVAGTKVMCEDRYVKSYVRTGANLRQPSQTCACMINGSAAANGRIRSARGRGIRDRAPAVCWRQLGRAPPQSRWF